MCEHSGVSRAPGRQYKCMGEKQILRALVFHLKKKKVYYILSPEVTLAHYENMLKKWKCKKRRGVPLPKENICY